MKKLVKGSFAILILCSGCTLPDDPGDFNRSISEESIPVISPKVIAIKNYLSRNEPSSTRSISYDLLPVITHGDTVMYLAQFDSGWELFSNSYSCPMSIMKCDSGKFQNDIVENPCRLLLRLCKNSSGYTDPTKPIGPDTGTTDDYDYLVGKYGKIYTESYISRRTFLQFKWGWKDGYCDDILINGDILNITSDNPDINGFTINKIISYDIN